MTPLEIQFELKKKDITQKSIADEIGVSETSVSKVINRLIVSDRVMKAVAKAVGKDHRAVFPEYYFGPKKRSTSKVASG